MEYDDTKKFMYCGPVFRDGKMIVVFSEGQLGTNVTYCMSRTPLQEALNEAEPAPGSASKVSFAVRAAILTEYNPKMDKHLKDLKEITHLSELTLDPNWDENYTFLAANAKANNFESDWDFKLPRVFASYWESLASQMKKKNFHSDDMLYEAFGEACEKNTIKIKIVEKVDGMYNETQFKDGILYIMSQPKTWDTNVGYIGYNLVDQL
jgi:hypothetical protein